ncbi:MAG: DUF1150 family protein [Alphaproteobacteria bacterium]|nr:DUF1150 family protein [Alphaproteobacteria bacterium]MBQ7285483.1 DUF1150 family protein [Alphaproteobacteria bacterium]
MLNKNMLTEIEGLLTGDEWNDDNSAFIRRGEYKGQQMWLICNAEGERIAATDNRDFAFIVAKQNDMEPYSVH